MHLDRFVLATVRGWHHITPTTTPSNGTKSPCSGKEQNHDGIQRGFLGNPCDE